MLVAGACSGGGDPPVAEEPTPVSGDRRGTTTTSTTPIDVSTIPEKIDEPYINAVLKALDEVDAQATKIIVQKKQLVPAAAEHLLAIYNTEELDEQVEVWLTTIKNGFKNVSSDPGARRTTVTKIVSSSPNCIYAEVEQDFSATAVNAPPPNRAFVQLVPLAPERNAKDLNPTAWMIHDEGNRPVAATPRDPCAA
ncbi:MAG: hypothetical protein CYG61_09230 [Actinobacteria bacterium]|nr:MAG: hypothetical protein CYG61_09230 [Actinomycetota bacterium]